MLAAVIDELRHPKSEGGNVGGYDMSGLGVIIAVAGVSTILGLIFSVLSIGRQERLRPLAVICLVVYLLPGLWTATHLLNFELGKGRLERYEEAQKNKP